MRAILVGVVLLGPGERVGAADSPLVEKYLHSGELAQGEQALEARLAAAPKDDQARFGLGVIRFVRGVERLGQFLHEYGVKGQNAHVPFLRLPVPKNPDPAPITYMALRRGLNDLHRDLGAAEEALAGVTDEKVRLPLRLAGIRLDLDGDGRATDKFLDILKAVMRQQRFDFLAGNPDFLVAFDRGDVAWLRAYCHLLMGMLDVYLAADTERQFDLTAPDLFARPKQPADGTAEERRNRAIQSSLTITFREPARLGRFRQHFLRVAELNRETWKFVRSETDDDHEWLPNPKQHAVIGLPVRDEMIDRWLAMMGELEALLKGERTFLKSFLARDGKGLNLKVLLDDPPAKLAFDNGFPGNLPDRYFSDKDDINLDTVFRVWSLFEESTAVAYAAWFN